MEDQKSYDDRTVFLQVQQFLDEWYYRVLHAGLGMAMDRSQALMIAFEIFELSGMEVTPEQKEEWATMEDDDEITELIVKAMPMSCRKSFEHFALQLQLVVSTATRVRHALEEGIPEEVARCMEDGDTGVSTQILKQCCVDAGTQISELTSLRASWLQNTEARLGRLARCQQDAEHAQQQLAAISSQLDAFGGDQANKSKKVLMSMAGNADKGLMHTVFSTWAGWYLKRKSESAIHNKFKAQIQSAEDALMLFKQKQLKAAKSLLMRNAAMGDSTLKAEILKFWYTYIVVEGHNKEMDAKVQAAKDRLHNAKASSKENTKRVMDRMAAGQDAGVVQLAFKAWCAAMDEIRMDRQLDGAVAAQEAQIQEFLKNKSDQAKGVLARVSGGTESGIMKNALSAWIELYKQEKQEKEMDELVNGQNERFKSLNLKQRGNARNVASKANRMEEENTMAMFFHAWHTDTKMERVIKHYGGRLDQKKQQLDAVQNMFRSFATQLEQGIGNTPRSQRKSHRSMKSDSPAPELPGRPPVPQK